MTLQLNEAWTLILALLTIGLGKAINHRLPWLERGNIPPSVTAGLLLSLLFAALRAGGIVDVELGTAIRDILLLVFFASLGLGAHFSRLMSAGRGVIVICLAITLAILAQNAVGVAVAKAFGDPAKLGLFLGSIAYLGGHGTTVAWAGSSFAAGVEGALETGIASATLGLVLGGVVAGPVAVWLLTRRTVGALHETTFAAGVEPPASAEPPFSSDRWLRGIFWLAVALGVGPLLRDAADGQGWNLPGFLTAMAVAIMLTNAADALRRPVDTEVTDLIGTVALRVFLAITLLSLDWMSLADRLPAVLTGAVAQVGVIAAVALLLVYPLLGRDRDAAVASAGFIGFGLGAMPVGMAVMNRLMQRFGEAPRAMLIITLGATLYQDTANALILTALFRWLGAG